MAMYSVSVPRLCGVYFLPRPISKTETNIIWNNNNYAGVVWLPLVSMTSHSKLNDSSSYTTLSQTFTNPSKTISIPEAKYTFPLYENCAVSSFSCYVGDRVLKGIVREKYQAKAEYKEAVEQGENAALLEQHEPDVFTTKIGNIGPGVTVKVEIGYIMELKHDAEADGLRFTIPTSIAPRYGTPPPGIFGPEENVAVTTDKSRGMKISVEISMASNVRSVQSPSHPIRLSLGGHKPDTPDDQFNPKHALATLSQSSTELGKDFYLIVSFSDLSSPRAILETHKTIPNSKALMVTLVPKFKLPPGPKPEIVFVVDRSGSMSNKITSLKSALEVFLKSLPVGVKFNICSFGSRHSFLWPKSKSYNADTLKEAQTHIADFQANFGGTEILPPVRASVEGRLEDLPLEIFVLTDGEVWNKEALFSYVEENTRDGNVRVFSLGIGEDVSHSLVEGLARVGRGFAQIVGNSGEGLEGKVVRMLRGGLSTHVKDYRLEWDGRVEPALKLASSTDDARGPDAARPLGKISLFDVKADTDSTPSKSDELKNRFAELPPFEVPAVLQSPYKIPPLFPFSRTTVYCILSGSAADRPPKSLWLKSSTIYGIELELEIAVKMADDNGITIHQLGARKILQELEEGTGYLHSGKYGVDPEKQPGQFSDWIEREGERVGLLYQIVSKWTSFVAVEKKKKDVSHMDIDDGDKSIPSEHADADMDDEFDEYEIIGKIDDTVPHGSTRARFSPFTRHGRREQHPGLAAPSSGPPGAMRYMIHQSGQLSLTSSFSTVPYHPSSGPSFGQAADVSTSRERRRSRDNTPAPEIGSIERCSRDTPGSIERDFHHSSPVLRGGGNLFGAPFDSSVSVLHTPAQTTTALISFQFFEGSFPSGELLAALLGIERHVLDDKISGMDLTSLSETKRRQVWATALAVAMFELKLKSEKDTWDLVVEKARGWLQSVVGAAQVDILVTKAGENLPSTDGHKF